MSTYQDGYDSWEASGGSQGAALPRTDGAAGSAESFVNTPFPASRGSLWAGTMRPRKHKLMIFLVLQLSFFFGLQYMAWRTAGLLFPVENDLCYRLVLPLSIFFLAYFILMWRSVYSRDYHYYLKNNHGAVIRSAPLPVALTCAVFLALGTHSSHPLTVILLYLTAGVISFSIVQGMQYLWIRYLSRLGYFKKKVLVIGCSPDGHSSDSRVRDFGRTKSYAGEITRSGGSWLWKPAGNAECRPVDGFPQIKTIILKENIGDIILFQGDWRQREVERQLIGYCQSLSIGYYLVPEAVEKTATKNVSSLLFPYIPVLERFAGTRDSLTAVSLKRLIDMAISFITLLLFIPVGLLIALAILVDDGGPVFYVSTRIGKNGRPIRFYKFRTMIRGADREKSKLLAFNDRGDGPLFKMKNDPRVTRVGGLLRRCSLDEFPQLFSVLVGSMSLVGPRPHLPGEVAEYRESDYLRLECMPGIVGLPQVTGRNTMGFREWVSLDLRYRKGWSIALDLGIIGRTIVIFVTDLFTRRSRDHY